jgi:hypothetical protein
VQIARSDIDPVDQPSARAGGRTFPFVRLVLYYAAATAVVGLIFSLVPAARPTSPALPETVGSKHDAEELLRASGAVRGGHPITWGEVIGRAGGAFLAMAWSIAMALPVAWALKHTRKLRYDPSLVHTLIILPIVVAGVVLVVRNSLALAFALAGIVAGVRFRQKLDEPEQAVYVLLALGIGLAAGVQAFDVALVMSLVFTLVVLTLWRYDIGDIFAGGRGAQLAIGDPRLLRPPTMSVPSPDTREIDAAIAAGMKPHGMLVIRTTDPDAVCRGLEVVLGRMAAQWRLGEPVFDRAGGPARIEVPLELKGKEDPAELMAEIESRLSDHISAAEYIPFGNPGDLD